MDTFECPENDVEHFERLTADVLKRIPDDELDLTIFTHVQDRIGGNWDREYEIVKSLPIGQQMIYTTLTLEGEVANGGFLQYFWNSSGQFAMEALAGYRLIGASQHAKLTEQAINVFMKRIPRLAPLRWVGTIEAFFRASKREKALDELSRRFWPIVRLADQLRVTYIREHPEDFED